MRFPRVQGPRVQRSRRHRAAASFVDEWQVRLIAIGPFYLRLTKRSRWDDRVAGEAMNVLLHHPDVLDMERRLDEAFPRPHEKPMTWPRDTAGDDTR